MSPLIIFLVFVSYTVVIFTISWISSRKADNDSFFVGNKKSPWFVVAYGMIGASLSGVTFISIPGWVGSTWFTYFVIVIGYVAGYSVITLVLLPVYYKLKLVSIYSYLKTRFGTYTYKTGASLFIISRVIGASFRMYLVISVLQVFVFNHYGIPFWLTVLLFMILINLYTIKGGIKTIVWTDTLQTTFMLTAVVLSIALILEKMDVGLGEIISQVWESSYSTIIVGDIDSKQYFIKLFLSGMFISIVMTGLDQDMMQKNLSCKNIRDAQKNMTALSLILVPVNLIFLFLGAVLYIYSEKLNIPLPVSTDHLFPTIAFQYLGMGAGIVFIIGLISAAYSSADSALTSLTTSVSLDIFEFDKKFEHSDKLLKRYRMRVHLGITLLIIFVVVLFGLINNEAIIAQLFTFAGYTYGPLLGLFAFGLFTKFNVQDKWVPYIAVLAPLMSYFISKYSVLMLNGYQIGFELLIINGALTFLCLLLIRNKNL
jgi:Na+/proline symporter